MSIVLRAFVHEQGSHLNLRVNQFQRQVDHLIIIITLHFDGVSLFDLLDKLVVLTKDNVCLVQASIETTKDIIFINILSISVQLNVHQAFDKCSFDNNCLESFFDFQISFESIFTTESDLDGVGGVKDLLLADLVKDFSLATLGLK